jgi:hypothetical protein
MQPTDDAELADTITGLCVLITSKNLICIGSASATASVLQSGMAQCCHIGQAEHPGLPISSHPQVFLGPTLLPGAQQKRCRALFGKLSRTWCTLAAQTQLAAPEADLSSFVTEPSATWHGPHAAVLRRHCVEALPKERQGCRPLPIEAFQRGRLKVCGQGRRGLAHQSLPIYARVWFLLHAPRVKQQVHSACVSNARVQSGTG